MADKSHADTIDVANIDIRLEAHLAPSALRAFLGATPLDKEIDGLALPEKPRWLRLTVRLLRWYRRVRPAHISQRCVFDPSCSRYAEMAMRRHGAVRGTLMTVSRLQRCRPGAGGTDIP